MTARAFLFWVPQLAGLLLSSPKIFSADWPPVLDQGSALTHSADGRVIERFMHGPRESWGYPAASGKEWDRASGEESGASGQNHNSFYLVTPKRVRPGAPLCVVLHSANRTAYDYLAYEHLNRKIEASDDPFTVATRSPDDFYALYLSSTNGEWWGWTARRSHPQDIPPAEKRVLDTVEWVIDRYQIDRSRVYLCGVSMGGCGALALGMAHGDVFAAVRVQVPAGTEYAASRVGGFLPVPPAGDPLAEHEARIGTIFGTRLPEPPVIVDLSASNDNWSKTQPALLQAARQGRLPLVVGWGPFGHSTFTSRVAKFPLCAAALDFPWQEIRKDEACPVFTNASCDQLPPWTDVPSQADESGQINAYFRWKALSDTPAGLSMQLWIAQPAIGDSQTISPESATTDITLRRVQNFPVRPGTCYAWRLVRDGVEVRSGQTYPDAADLLTVPGLELTTNPAELSVRKQ